MGTTNGAVERFDFGVEFLSELGERFRLTPYRLTYALPERHHHSESFVVRSEEHTSELQSPS